MSRRELAERFRRCLDQGDPPEVNLSVPRHAVITAVLREFAYDPAYRGRGLPVVYRDGSRPPDPLPLGCLDTPGTRPGTEGLPELRLGLCSFRHLSLDYEVDLYLMRNVELGSGMSMADEDQATFRRTVEILDDPYLEHGGNILALHTGLEPMIVAFYRGLIRVLADRALRSMPRTLVVTPCLYQRGTSEAEVPHAENLDSSSGYATLEPWW